MNQRIVWNTQLLEIAYRNQAFILPDNWLDEFDSNIKNSKIRVSENEK
jgi:hypothetical protein